MMNSRTTHWQFVLWECFEQAKGFSLFMLKAIINGVATKSSNWPRPISFADWTRSTILARDQDRRPGGKQAGSVVAKGCAMATEGRRQSRPNNHIAVNTPSFKRHPTPLARLLSGRGHPDRKGETA